MPHRHCVILFDENELGNYFAGQTMRGQILLTLQKAKKLKAIKLQICGYAGCEWKDKRAAKKQQHSSVPANDRKKRNMFYGHEDYLANTQYLVGSEYGDEFSIVAGTHSYAFSCSIPETCPSSFEGAYGFVRYEIKVTFIIKDHKANNRSVEKCFKVTNVLDLNQEAPALKMPINNEAMESLCFLYNKPIQMKVDLPRSGFVPGELLPVRVSIHNKSGFDCKKVLIILNLCATYSSNTPSLQLRREKICVLKKYCGAVATEQRKQFEESLRVPATPASSEHLSRVVRIAYEICVIASMSAMMRNPKAIIPITIGNVALNAANEHSAGSQFANPFRCGNFSNGDNSAAEQYIDDNDVVSLQKQEPSHSNANLPSYDEAVFMSAVGEMAPTTTTYVAEHTHAVDKQLF